jgi:hypothetical protein
MRSPPPLRFGDEQGDQRLDGQAVILTNRGSTIHGEYDGYGRAGEMGNGMEYAACLHEACWEKAGKPGFKHYGEPSAHAPDQGFFFDDADHDVIDPRITEGRDELLRGHAIDESHIYAFLTTTVLHRTATRMCRGEVECSMSSRSSEIQCRSWGNSCLSC